MRKNTTESTEPPAVKPVEESKVSKPKNSGRNWRPIMVMGAILFLAAFVRVAFSFSVSAGSGFALSGGTDASNNLRFIESIVEYRKVRFTDNWLNYPDGSLIVVPVLFDAIMAAFAMLVDVFMKGPVESSSLVLAVSGPVFGMLACIPMYFVGKEMFSSKIAGYASAAFLALCPVFVQESVFSNGTGMSFAVFLFLFGIYFLIKALKGLNDNVSAYKTSIFAGIFIAAAMASWIDFREVAIPLVIVMVAQTIIDRFKGKDPRPAATVYSMVLAIGFVLPCIGYTVVGYFNALVSGTLFFIVLAIGFATAYSWTYRKPWLLTLPICAGVCLIIMAVLSFAAPTFYGYVVSGNTFYDAGLVDLMGRQYLTLSQLTAYYGVVTYWFVFLVCLYMVYRFLKNSSSALYVFTLIWLFVMTLTLGHDSVQAAFAAPVFALGFGVVVKVVLERVNFKAYFSGIKTGAGAKIKIRRIISPVPLVSILVAVLLVAGPNMMQTIDAGISSNDADEYNEQISDVTGNDQFGTLSYYIKTDDTWTVRDALKSLKGQYGAVASWMSYSDDIKIYANMKAFSDMYGNGTDTVSNILLANGVNGASAAALLITALMNKGMTDDVKAKLTASGFSNDHITIIEGVLDSADYIIAGSSSARDLVVTDYDTYGAVDSGVSDKNVKYLYLSNFIATNYHAVDINAAYDALGLRTPYIMVTGDMMPFFVGYSNVFLQMGLLNGYIGDTSYGTVSKFSTFGYNAYYSGVYDLTQALYDTMLYRAYIGMSPSEAGYSSMSEYLTALSAADVTVQMHPGYGLSNYTVEYWMVKYNPSNNATADDDGWKDMKASEAIALQKTNGGLINYLSGSPLILKYVSNSTGSTVSGTVKDSLDAPMADVRVVAVDSQGVVRATTHTSEDGTFKIFVADKATSTLVYYAGAGTASSGGVIVGVNPATSPDLSGVATKANLNILLDGGDGFAPIVDGGDALTYDVEIVNSAAGTDPISKKVGDVVTGGLFEVGVGSQTVTLSKDGTTVATGTFNVTSDMVSLIITADSYSYEVTVTDIYGAPVDSGIPVTLTGAQNMMVDTDDKGVAKFPNVVKGSYKLGVNGYYVDSPDVTIESNSTKSLKLAYLRDVTVTLPAAGVTVFVYGDQFSTSVVADSTTPVIDVPVSDSTGTTYTVYCYHNGKVYSAPVTVTYDGGAAVTLTEKNLATVTGKLKDADGNDVAGTVYLMNAAGEKYKVAATAEDGFKAYVPADITFAYATDSTRAFFGDFAVTGDLQQDITMAEADTATVRSIGWAGVSYSYVMVDVVIDGKTMPVMSSSGTATFLLPKNVSANVKITPSALFKEVTGDIAADHATLSVDGKLTLLGDPAELEVAVTNSGAMSSLPDDTTLTIGSVNHKISEWVGGETFKITTDESLSVLLGSSSQKYYFSGTHYFNPRAMAATPTIDLEDLLNYSTLDEVTYYFVNVTDLTTEASGDYTVKVYYNDDNQYTSIYSSGEKRIASKADSGATYTIEIVNKDKTKVLINTFAPADTKEFTIASCVDATVVKGFIGSDVDTKITFTEGGNTLKVSVSDGSFSTALKKNVAYDIAIDDTVSGVRYVYNGSRTFDGSSETQNVLATATPVVYDVDLSTGVVANGQVTEVTFSIPVDTLENTTENPETFKVTAGSGWQSYTITSLSRGLNGYVLQPGATNPVLTFKGYFNNSLYDFGTSALSLTVDGGTDKISVNFTNFAGDAGIVFVNKAADVVSDHDYEYTYSLVNTGSAKTTLNVALDPATAEGWEAYYKITTHLGTTVVAPTGTVDLVPGTTTFAVAYMPTAGSSTVPSVKVTLSPTGTQTIQTSTPDEITVSEGKAQSSVSPTTAEVSVTDMSASGRGVVNDQGSIPTIVWVMLAAMALLLITIFWMASKRGVFARRK